MNWCPSFNDLWEDGLMREHLHDENQIPDDGDNGVLGDDPFKEEGDEY